jgi:hypothetical protein
MIGLNKSVNIIVLVVLLASCVQDEKGKNHSLPNHVTIVDSLLVRAISEFQKEILYRDKTNDTEEGVIVVRHFPNDTCHVLTITSIISDYDMENRLPSHYTFVKDHLIFLYTGYEGLLSKPDYYLDSLKRYYKNKLEEVTQPDELEAIKFDTLDFVPIEIPSTYDPPTWYVNYCDRSIRKNLYQ